MPVRGLSALRNCYLTNCKNCGTKKLREIKHPADTMNIIGQAITKSVGTYLQSATWLRQLGQDASTSLCKSMVAVPVDKKPHLFQFDNNGAPEHADENLSFIALGSGQAIADPFLAHVKKLLWPNARPSLAEGRLAAVCTVDHVRRNSAGFVGGEIQLGTLSGAAGTSLPTTAILASDDVQEHLQSIAAAERALVEAVRTKPSLEAQPPPPVPKD